MTSLGEIKKKGQCHLWVSVSLPSFVPFSTPSKRVVGGPKGDSGDKEVAVRLVLRGDTHLKSGPGSMKR